MTVVSMRRTLLTLVPAVSCLVITLQAAAQTPPAPPRRETTRPAPAPTPHPRAMEHREWHWELSPLPPLTPHAATPHLAEMSERGELSPIAEAAAARVAERVAARVEARAAVEAMGHAMPTIAAEWHTMGHDATMVPTPRPAWSPEDPADSLYRQARELINRGEWRRAAAAFGELQAKFPNSEYAADALYWQAFALYRIGGTEELRRALTALETRRTRYPGVRNQTDAAALGTRIRGALAARGDATAAAQLRSSADSIPGCDREEQAVRSEALNAIAQSDPEGAMPMLQRVLQRRDNCSAMLRRSAVFLIGSKRRDDAAVALLSQVARQDPSEEVRDAAIGWLARYSGDAAVITLEELVRTGDERTQRAAARALVGNPTARARQAVRNVVERSETPERIRLDAIGAFDKERATAEDIAWLRTLYTRTGESARVRRAVVATLARIGGAENDQWLLTVARNTDEDSETRSYALQRVAQTLPMAELVKLYDASAERRVRVALIDVLSKRSEAEATDKLIDIIKTGTDPDLRRQAISALTRKKDERSMRLLMEIIEK